MAKIVSPPKPKHVDCDACGATIEYLPEEVDYSGDYDSPPSMDSEKCLQDLVDAVVDGDMATAAFLANKLYVYLKFGSTLPGCMDLPDNTALALIISVLVASER